MPRLSLGNFPSSENTTGTAEHYNRTAKPGNSVATDPTLTGRGDTREVTRSFYSLEVWALQDSNL